MGIVFIGIIFPANLFAQLQTYKGTYAGGIAEYTYYVNPDMTRNFDGNFKYTTRNNDGFFVKGVYANNLKDGAWTSNIYGFNETVHYNQGLRHGAYKLSYKSEDTEIEIDAMFFYGVIDTLHYYSKDPKFGIINGSLNKNGNGIWVQGIGQIFYTQFFHKNIFIGAMTQEITTGDTDNSLEEISRIRDIVDEGGNTNSFSVENHNYHFIPIKENSIYHSNTDIFSAKFNYLHERALFLIFDYHFSLWHIDLTRGEVLNNYIVCYLLEPDKVKNMEEQRTRDILRQEIDLFAIKFYQTEYGKAVKHLQHYCDLPNMEYEREKSKYFENLLYKFKPKSIRISELNSDNTKTLNASYAEQHPYLIREINQKYIVPIPQGLQDSSILVIPLELGLNNEDLCVSKAIVFYFNTDNMPLNLYLQYCQDKITLGDRINTEIICNSSQFSIKRNDSNYFAEYLGEKYLIKPANLLKKNKKECFYLIWENNDIDLMTNTLSKEETQISIEERFNIR